MKETPDELATRKLIYMTYITRQYDSPKLRKEASIKFDKANGIYRKSLLEKIVELPARLLHLIVYGKQ